MPKNTWLFLSKSPGSHTCWLNYFTLVYLWCGWMVTRSVYCHVITKFSRMGRLPHSLAMGLHQRAARSAVRGALLKTVEKVFGFMQWPIARMLHFKSRILNTPYLFTRAFWLTYVAWPQNTLNVVFGVWCFEV